MPSFSLVGALEFRRVVSSLQRDAAASTLSHFESPLTPYSYRRARGTSSASRSPLRTPNSNLHNLERDPWDAALGVPLDERSPPRIIAAPLHETPPDVGELAPIPSIAHTPASPTAPSETDAESQTYVADTPSARAMSVLAHVGHILFPTLHNFGTKSVLGKIAAVLAAPAVMALTVTLPVVVTSYQDPGASEKKYSHSPGATESRLIDFEEEGVERTLIAEEEVEEGMHDLQFNKWLMAVQCCLGPLFCVAVLLGASLRNLEVCVLELICVRCR